MKEKELLYYMLGVLKHPQHSVEVKDRIFLGYSKDTIEEILGEIEKLTSTKEVENDNKEEEEEEESRRENKAT